MAKKLLSMTMMLLMLVLVAACDDDEPGSSFSSAEKSALEALSGTWTSENGYTVTFSPWSTPKSVDCSVSLGDATLDQYTSRNFHGEMNESNTVIISYYYFWVTPSSNKITAFAISKNGGYNPSEKDKLNYTYKLSNSNKELTLTSGSTSITYYK